jgi:hypothetical protein
VFTLRYARLGEVKRERKRDAKANVNEEKQSQEEFKKIIRAMAKTKGLASTIILIIFCEGEC